MAGIVPPALLEQIRAANEIVDVIGAAIPLKRAGAHFVALCPFHKEKTPSFHVNPGQQMFHCFGCHKGGDVFTFIREYENLSFPEALRRLAERARIPLEFDQNPDAQQARFLKDTLLTIQEEIAQRWQAALKNHAAGEIARQYLQKRQVTSDAIDLFRLGYAPDEWDDTVNWAKSKGHDLQTVEQSGLILAKEKGGYYDRFRGRLMFPICDEQGRVIGFSGRVLQGDEKTAKYVNSPETPIFTKGRVMYGLDKSKRALIDAGFAVVCEGQLDLIACFMSGVQNVIAPQGTALTGEHARILKRYVNEVVLCFDSDTAGQKAAVRSVDDLLAAGLNIKVATLPAPHDPDSFIKQNGPQAFKELLAKSEGFFDFYLKRLCQTHDMASDSGRVAVVNLMAEAVKKTGNAVLIDTYAQKTSQRLSVQVQSVRQEFQKRRGAQRAAPETERGGAENVPQPEPKPNQLEHWLVKVLLTDDQHAGWVADRLQVDWIQSKAAREVVERRLACHREGRWHGPAGLLNELATEEARALVTESVCELKPIAHAEELLKGSPGKPGIITRLQERHTDRKIADLASQMSQPDLTESEMVALFQQQLALRQQKRSIAAQ